MTPLALLPDEALDSYFSRNLVYSQLWGSSSIYQRLNFDYFSKWSQKKIESLASELGLEQIFGYNYLLHYHTNYYRHAFVVANLDESYGAGRHGGCLVIESSATDLVKICPACVSEDIYDHGFIYWRRSHQVFDINVCSKHNLILISACSGCSKSFELKRHFFELPWGACECGLSIFNLDHQSNEDQAELSLSRFMTGLYEYKYQLHFDGVARLIMNRVASLGLTTIDEVLDKFCSSMQQLHFNIFAWNLNEILRGRRCYIWGLPYVLAALFGDFSSFAEAVVKENVRRKLVSTEWNKKGSISGVAPRSAPFHSSRPYQNAKVRPLYGSVDSKLLFILRE